MGEGKMLEIVMEKGFISVGVIVTVTKDTLRRYVPCFRIQRFYAPYLYV
jgi:hypothetical protein